MCARDGDGMNIGPRSVLFGAHQFAIHPVFVAKAWTQLYGFPRDPRLWCAFVLHDLGYLFMDCPNMDGPEGERHPEWAARVMGRLFGQEWYDLCLYHSRFYSKRAGRPFSRLCVADKLAFALTPRWLYLPMVRATGEIHEYMRLAEERTEAGEPKFAAQGQHRGSEERWFAQVAVYMTRWVEVHKDGAADTWTPDTAAREQASDSGVWR